MVYMNMENPYFIPSGVEKSPETQIPKVLINDSLDACFRAEQPTLDQAREGIYWTVQALLTKTAEMSEITKKTFFGSFLGIKRLAFSPNSEFYVREGYQESNLGHIEGMWAICSQMREKIGVDCFDNIFDTGRIYKLILIHDFGETGVGDNCVGDSKEGQELEKHKFEEFLYGATCLNYLYGEEVAKEYVKYEFRNGVPNNWKSMIEDIIQNPENYTSIIDQKLNILYSKDQTNLGNSPVDLGDADYVRNTLISIFGSDKTKELLEYAKNFNPETDTTPKEKLSQHFAKFLYTFQGNNTAVLLAYDRQMYDEKNASFITDLENHNRSSLQKLINNFQTLKENGLSEEDCRILLGYIKWQFDVYVEAGYEEDVKNVVNSEENKEILVDNFENIEATLIEDIPTLYDFRNIK